MAPTYRAGLGPTFLEPLLLVVDGGTVTGVPVATSDADAEAAPVSNCYWIRETSISGGSDIFVVGPGQAFAALSYEWPVIEAYRLEGTLSAIHSEEEVCRFDMDGGGTDVRLLYDPLSTSTFRYRLTQGATNAYGSTFNTSTNYGLRFEFNGTTAKLWVNGSLDITIAVSDKPTRFFHVGSTLPSTSKQYFCGLCWRGSNDIADRPSTTLTVEGLDPNADFESADFGDEGTCSDGSGTYTDWAPNADDSDTTIYLCEEGGVDTEETSELTALTMTTPKLVVPRFLMQANAAKTLRTDCREHDGTNFLEFQNVNIATMSWRGYSRPYILAPDSAAWTQAKVNSLKSGIAIDSGNTANCDMAMQRVEVFDLGDDPPPTENRRRVMAQVA